MSNKRSPPSDFAGPSTNAKMARSDTAPAAATSTPSASAAISSSHDGLDVPYPPLDPTQSPPPPQFGQPVPLITFSYDSSHTQHLDDSALRILAPTPPIGADLNYARERWTRKPDTRGRLDGLLKALIVAKGDATKAGGELKVGVCTWRGVMTKILTAPYDDRDTITLNAQLVAGTLYLEEHHTPDQLIAKNEMTARQREMTYIGYAFESWSTRAPGQIDQHTTPNQQKHDNRPEWGGDVNTNEQWCVVVKTRLGAHRLVLGGEVDCVHSSGIPWPRPPTPASLSSLVELKTHIMPRRGNERDEQMFDRKTMRVWTQSFLLGVPEVMFGMRSPRGRVEAVRRFRTEEFPRRVRGRKAGDMGAWSPDVLLGWGGKALDVIRATIERDGMSGSQGEGAAQVHRKLQERQVEAERDGGGSGNDGQAKEGRNREIRRDERDMMVWRVVFRPGKGMQMFKLSKKEMEEEVQADSDISRVGVLPDWFWSTVHTDSTSA